ncbi:MAG: glycosyltransferase family 2 protein, partial [Nitrososphaera sp.]
MRTVLRGITVFMKSLPLLDPFRYKLLAWQLLSHKLARWLVPFAMISAYLSNIVLVPQSSLYAMSLFLQTSFYGIAVAGLWTTRFSQTTWLKLASFLVLVNLSILRAWYLYATGQRVVAWEPSKR